MSKPSLRARRRALFAVLAVALAAPLAAQIPDSAAIAALAKNPNGVLPFDPRARMRTLPNGLRYYVRANARPEKRTELRLVVNTGSVMEDDDQLGLAHMVEHMAFNGTRRFAKQQIVNFIEHAGMTFGADLNAGTTFDETIYQLQLPSDTGNYVSRGLDWFVDIAAGGVMFDSAEVEKERPVVIEEWRLGKGAGERMQTKQLPVLFKGSRYATRMPIGTKESLDAFKRAQLLRFYRDWYRPDLIAVIVVGDFNADSMEAIVRAKFGAILPAAANARSRDGVTLAGHTETLVAIATDAEAPESNIGIIWHQPVMKRTLVRDYQRDLTEQLFLAALNQRFDEIVRKPNAPFVNAGSGQGRLVRAGESFSLSAIVEDGGIARGLTALLTEAERVRRFGFTKDEFDRQKTSLLRSIEIQFAERDKTESNNFAGRYIDHYLTSDPMLGIEIRSPLIRTIVPTITLEQVNAVAGKWLVENGRVVLASAPAKPGVVVPTESELLGVIAQIGGSAITARADAAPSAPLIATPPAPGKIVSERKNAALGTTEWTLSNGARVIVKPTTFQADEVLISGVSVGGIGVQSPDRYFSALLGPLLLERGGAAALDADALQRQMTGKVAAVSASVDQHGEGVSGKASPKDLQPFFEMLWAKTQMPRVDSAAVMAFKQQYTAVFRNRANEPSAIFADTIGATMTRYNPLARPVSSGLVDSLDVQVGLEVFRDRFKDFSDFTFVIVGSIKPDDVRPFAEKWLAALPGGGRKETPKDAGIRPPTGAITKIVRKGMEPQAHTTMVLTGMTPWTREAATRAEAISEILDIRLRNALREDLGGTYDVGAGVALERWPEGRFTASVSFGAAPERIDSLANVALTMLRRFAVEGPTRDELAKVRENMTRSRETALTQNGFWAALFESQALWGDDPAENVNGFKARVAALDADSIRALAKIVLSETNLARFTLLPEKTGGGQ